MRLLVFFKLIRWKNLCILLLSLLLFKFIVFPFFNTTSLLTSIEFTLFLLATLFIAAGGYVINDVFDIKCDTINKPQKSFIPNKLSEKTAKNTYWLLTTIGIVFGSIVSFQRNTPFSSLLFIGIASVLYFYSSHLKKIAFIGNVTIALLVSSSLIVFALFDTNLSENSVGIYYLYVFTFFSFCINLLREIIKDLEDMKGDYNAGMKTLPIVLGVERTKKTAIMLSVIPLYFSISFLTNELRNNLWAQLFFILCILMPFFYFIYKTYYSITNKQFHQLSNLLKWMLIFGLLLLLLITK